MKSSLAFLLLLFAGSLAHADAQSSWVFQPGPFTHDPTTGARVGQYARIAPIEPLPDVRNVTSGYRRTQTRLRGTDGSADSYLQVQSWGNGRGGLDAEWERFHNAWQDSYLTGTYRESEPAYPYGHRAVPHGYGRHPNYGGPGGGGWPPSATPYPQQQRPYYRSGPNYGGHRSGFGGAGPQRPPSSPPPAYGDTGD